MDPRTTALRRRRRSCVCRSVPPGGCGPGRLSPAASPSQFSRTRVARLDPDRELHCGRDIVPGRCRGAARAADPAASSRVAPALIGAAGAGLISSAVFTTYPVSGYPPRTPDALTQPSQAGAAHNLAAVPVFFGLPAAALACSWRSWRGGQRGWALYSGATAVTMPATMALAGAGFGQSPRLVRLGGLFQRAGIITGVSWLTALSARALRPAHATRGARPAAP